MGELIFCQIEEARPRIALLSKAFDNDEMAERKPIHGITYLENGALVQLFLSM